MEDRIELILLFSEVLRGTRMAYRYILSLFAGCISFFSEIAKHLDRLFLLAAHIVKGQHKSAIKPVLDQWDKGHITRCKRHHCGENHKPAHFFSFCSIT
jgi:hypothetical protein